MTEQYVFKDDELKRSGKAALLAQHNLERVSAIATQTEEEHSAAPRAFAWLTIVCTKPSYGILRPSGWYPSGTAQMDRRRLHDDAIDLGLDSIDFFDRDDRPAVRNLILLSWMQTLHPWSNLQERELILTCFKSAPELVAAYFAEKEKSMQLEPKLSNTWIGYASFLFEVVQLSVPERFGHGNDWAQLPPQTNVMIESVLPRPLTRKVLSRCLNQNCELILFFAVRILVLACQKLRKVRQMLEQGAEASKQYRSFWREASERLLERFVEQAPPMKDVIGAFRKIADDEEHALQREAVVRLLRLYFEVTPLQALEEQFDVSIALTAALGRAQNEAERTQMTELREIELQHLLQIARQSPGMRWFGKQGGLQYLPITTLLRLHAKAPQDAEMRKLATELLCSGQALSGTWDVQSLVGSVQEVEVQADALVWEFLDDSLARVSRKPVKYLDDLEGLIGGTGANDGSITPSLLCAVFLEQAPYLVQKDGAQNAMLMVELFLTLAGNQYSQQTIEDSVPGVVIRGVRKVNGWLDQRFQGTQGALAMSYAWQRTNIPSPQADEDVAITSRGQREDVESPFEPPPVESENHPELLKWAQKDLDMALEDGDISALVFSLCSQHKDVRTQALAQLRKLEDRLIASSLEDKDPIYVLIGELIETYERNYIAEDGADRLEYLAASFVAAALKVQMEPTHIMYPKLNRFLNKDPEWRVKKLPTYWMQNTVLSTPDSDDVDGAYWLEVRWVLDLIVDGLRTEADLEVFWRAGVFERFMAVFAAPGLERDIREKVLELLWRANVAEGGAEVLIKRCGVLSWLDAVKPSRMGTEGWLRERILENVSGETVERWAGIRMSEL